MSRDPDLLGPPRTSSDPAGPLRTFPDLPEPPRTSPDLLGPCRTFPDLPGPPTPRPRYTVRMRRSIALLVALVIAVLGAVIVAQQGRGPRGTRINPGEECPPGTTETRPGICQAPELPPPSISWSPLKLPRAWRVRSHTHGTTMGPSRGLQQVRESNTRCYSAWARPPSGKWSFAGQRTDSSTRSGKRCERKHRNPGSGKAASCAVPGFRSHKPA